MWSSVIAGFTLCSLVQQGAEQFAYHIRVHLQGLHEYSVHSRRYATSGPFNHSSTAILKPVFMLNLHLSCSYARLRCVPRYSVNMAGSSCVVLKVVYHFFMVVLIAFLYCSSCSCLLTCRAVLSARFSFRSWLIRLPIPFWDVLIIYLFEISLGLFLVPIL